MSSLAPSDQLFTSIDTSGRREGCRYLLGCDILKNDGLTSCYLACPRLPCVYLAIVLRMQLCLGSPSLQCVCFKSYTFRLHSTNTTPQYIMMAMYAHAVPAHPYNPVPPITKANGDTSYPIPSPFIPIRLPVFRIVIMLNEFVVKLIDIGVGGRRSERSRKKSLGGEMEGLEGGTPFDGMEIRERPSTDRRMPGPKPQIRGTKLRVD